MLIKIFIICFNRYTLPELRTNKDNPLVIELSEIIKDTTQTQYIVSKAIALFILSITCKTQQKEKT